MKQVYLKPTAASAKPAAVMIGVEEKPMIDAATAAAKQARMDRIKAAMNAAARQRRRELASTGGQD